MTIIICMACLIAVGYAIGQVASEESYYKLYHAFLMMKYDKQLLEDRLASANDRISDLEKTIVQAREKYAAIDEVIYEYYAHTGEVS